MSDRKKTAAGRGEVAGRCVVGCPRHVLLLCTPRVLEQVLEQRVTTDPTVTSEFEKLLNWNQES